MPTQGHHRQNPNTVGLVEIDDGKGESPREVTSGGRIVTAEAIRGGSDLRDHAFDVVVKATAKIWTALRDILGGGSRILRVRLGVKSVRLHRPTIRRILAETSSPGTSCT